MIGPCDFHNHPSYHEVVDAAKAFRDLNIIYRTGGRPSERLFAALGKAQLVMSRVDCPPVEKGPEG